MVALDPRGSPAAQGSAVLSPAGREFGIRIRGLCLRTEPAAGRVRRADPAFAGRGDFRQGQVRRLSPAQSVAELERFRAKWTPVRVKKTRQKQKLEPGSDSIRTDQAPAGIRRARALRRKYRAQQKRHPVSTAFFA